MGTSVEVLVAELTGMGFAEVDARRALRTYPSLEGATEFLLAQSELKAAQTPVSYRAAAAAPGISNLAPAIPAQAEPMVSPAVALPVRQPALANSAAVAMPTVQMPVLNTATTALPTVSPVSIAPVQVDSSSIDKPRSLLKDGKDLLPSDFVMRFASFQRNFELCFVILLEVNENEQRCLVEFSDGVRQWMPSAQVTADVIPPDVALMAYGYPPQADLVQSINRELLAKQTTSPKSESKTQPSPASSAASSASSQSFQLNDLLDVQDRQGKWVPAKIVEIRGSNITVNFVGWDAKWNETLNMTHIFDQRRIARYGIYSQACDPSKHAISVALNEMIDVLPPDTKIWTRARVCRIDCSQIQVEYITTGTIAQRVSRWFHLQHDESRVRSCVAPQSASAVAVSKLNVHAGTAAFLAGKSPAAVALEPASTIVSGPVLPKSNRSPEEPEVPRDESDSSFHAVGNIVDVLFEPTQSWRPAVVINKQTISSSVRIKVHFCEFDDATWDSWLDVSGLDSDRVRELGAGLTATEEELERKRRDVRFRELLSAQNLRVIEEQRDGNCLFRAFAHQLLGDAERHTEVRARCYEHMLNEKNYFWPFVASDADSIASYINSQRVDGKWGGEPELLALSEAYNKRVRVWLLQNDTLSQKSYFESATTLSCVELSYHGGSHYNSLLVLSGKLQEMTPLGEGSKSDSVRILDLRRANTSVAAPASSTATATEKVDKLAVEFKGLTMSEAAKASANRFYYSPTHAGSSSVDGPLGSNNLTKTTGASVALPLAQSSLMSMPVSTPYKPQLTSTPAYSPLSSSPAQAAPAAAPLVPAIPNVMPLSDHEVRRIWLSIATSHLEVSVAQFRALLEAVRENLVARVPPVSQSLKQMIRDRLASSIREWVYRQQPRLMLSYRHLLHEAKQLADLVNASL